MPAWAKNARHPQATSKNREHVQKTHTQFTSPRCTREHAAKGHIGIVKSVHSWWPPSVAQRRQLLKRPSFLFCPQSGHAQHRPLPPQKPTRPCLLPVLHGTGVLVIESTGEVVLLWTSSSSNSASPAAVYPQSRRGSQWRTSFKHPRPDGDRPSGPISSVQPSGRQKCTTRGSNVHLGGHEMRHVSKLGTSQRGIELRQTFNHVYLHSTLERTIPPLGPQQLMPLSSAAHRCSAGAGRQKSVVFFCCRVFPLFHRLRQIYQRYPNDFPRIGQLRPRWRPVPTPSPIS